MLPTGHQPQSSLRAAASVERYGDLMGAQLVHVVAINYSTNKIQVQNSNGTWWAFVGKKKTSGKVTLDATTNPPKTTMAGECDLPNIDDWGVIIPLNGDMKSVAWLCSLDIVEPSQQLINDSNYPGSAADLVHRRYDRHESGTFSILDRLGNLTMSWFKKLMQETDTPLQNLTVALQAGVLTITHYRGTPSTRGMVVESDQDGNINLQNFKPGGLQLASSVSIDNGGGFGVLTTSGSQIRFNENGDIVLDNGNGATVTISQSTGEITVESTSIKLGSGTLAALVKAGFLADYIAHVHTSAAPGQPTSPPTDVISPTDPTLITTQVEGA